MRPTPRHRRACATRYSTPSRPGGTSSTASRPRSETREGEIMAAYFVAQYVVKDPKRYREYQAAAGPTIQSSGGEVVAFDVAAETIEGTPPGPQTVIVKFESTEAAKAWYGSAAYQAVVGKRLAATHGFAVISQSMNFGR